MLAFFSTAFDWTGRSGRLMFAAAGIVTAVLAYVSLEVALSGAFRIAVFALLGISLFLFLAHGMRRVTDVGWHGGWAMLLVLPYVGTVFALVLMLLRQNGRDRKMKPGWRQSAMLVSLLFSLGVMTRSFWTPYWIPAGSMKPTLLVGDFVIATPLVAQPERGDVIVFRHPANGQDFVKRLVGLPGDRVQMQGGALHINGTALDTEPAGLFQEIFEPQGAAGSYPLCANAPVGEGGMCEKARLIETTPEGRSYAILDTGPRPNLRQDETPVFTVPEGQFFFIGDNRDNSTDSRVSQLAGGVGFVPSENLIAQARRIIFSSGGRSLLSIWAWRTDRFIKRIVWQS